TTGGVHINTMTGYRQQKPRFGLTKCPDLVDHYIVYLDNSFTPPSSTPNDLFSKFKRSHCRRSN
ncbi:hypothetical protein ACSZMV_21940, partial [Aeromonas veronii]